MKRIKKPVSAICLIFLILSANGSVVNPDSLRYEVLMNSSMLKEIKTNKNFISSADITSDRLLLLSSSDQFYQLGWGGITTFGNKSVPAISSFAFTSDGLLMTIRNKELYYMDSIGNLSLLYKLPNQGMGISSGKYAMYVYDRINSKNRYSLYLLAGGGRYSKILDVPGPINYVSEYNNSILFCTGNALMQYNTSTKELKALASLPENKIIKSFAVDPSSGWIYFSTETMICAVKDSEITVITDKLGGIVRYFHGLIVFSPSNSLILRIVGLNNTIVVKSTPVKSNKEELQPVEILTNSTIIELVNDELPDGIIINIINHSMVSFNLDVDSMIDLSGKKVSSEIIMAMKEAMSKQKTEGQSKK